jgi:hypothetical protein
MEIDPKTLEDLIKKFNNSNVSKCDDECQREKTLQRLQSEYIQAQKNKEEAPKKYEASAKRLKIFKEGGVAYQKYLEDNSAVEAREYIKLIENHIDNNIKNVNSLIEVHKTNYNHSKIFGDLADKYQEKGNYFNYKKNGMENVRNIANRKSEYDVNNLLFYNTINTYIRRLLYIILIAFIYIIIIRKRDFSRKNIIILFVLIVFTFSITSISRYIVLLYEKYTVITDLESKIVELKDL